MAAAAGTGLLPGCAGTQAGGESGSVLKVVRRLRHDGVLSVAWSPDGTRLVSAGYPYILWNPHTGEKLHELGQPWAAFVVSEPVRFTADGHHVVVVSDNAKIDGTWVGFGLWNAETGRLERQVPIPTTYFAPQKAGDPWFMQLPGKSQALVVYRKEPGQPILTYDTGTWEAGGIALRIPDGWANCLDVSPDGKLLAIGSRLPVPFAGEPIGTIGIVDLVSGKTIRRIDGSHKSVTGNVAFSPDGRFIASAPRELGSNKLNSKTGKLELMNDPDPVRVWDVETGRKVISFEGPFPGASNLAFHPTRPWIGASLGTITGQTKGPEFRIWDWKTGALLTTQSQFNASAQFIAFSPDGRFVAMAGNDKRSGGGIDIAEIVGA